MLKKIARMILRSELDELREKIHTLSKELSKPQPTLADMYRDSVGLPMIDFNVGETGEPKHFLADLTEEQRKERITQLFYVFRNQTFKDCIDYWVNKFGNHALRRVSTDNLDTNLAIFSINGIAMIRKELEKAAVEYEAFTSPEEDELTDNTL